MMKYLHTPKKFLTSAATVAGVLFMAQGAVHAQALVAEEGVVTQRIHTVTEERPIVPKDGTRMVNLADYDVNNDGVLSRRETGEMLFKLLDSDGNQIIDNIEFEKRNMMTIAPMERETVVSYDFDNDGKPDRIERSTEVVTQQTMLSAFDKDGAGMSPKDLAQKEFLNMDINRDRAIDIYEWRGAYDKAIDEYNRSQARFNR